MEQRSDGRHASLALLRDRVVSKLLAVELFSGLAQGATATALGWQAYGRRHDPLVLGLLGLAEFIPAVALALPAGHAADRRDRRLVGGAGMAGTALVAVLLALDAASGDTQVWPLYALAAAAGVANAFVGPALGPLIAAAVPAGNLARAVAMTLAIWQVAIIAGPATAGGLQLLGNPAPYVFAAAASGVACVIVVLVPRSIGTAHVEEGEEATLAGALDGIRYLFAVPPLLGAISLDLVAVLFGGVTALIPVFSRDILHVGAAGNGILRAAPGIGAGAVGLIMAVRPPRRRIGRTLFLVVALYGVFTIMFGLSTSFALSIVALAGLAAADMVSMLIRGTLAPLLTPPSLRGRVSAVERVFLGASNELGAFESGVAAALIGVVPAAVLGGAASIAVAAIWSRWFPSLRAIDRFEDLPEPERSLSL